ncbi:DinB family protein [Kribbella capetownensis]|uniref:DinB family protein n=1 Tax=Kribbella capetownensis TaxID=1572659 RepID=A0A4R0JXJ9_9ACTN|nr:DinB family protein [Kribbella capetownensis]TCC50018.1 DinB family protein [Kribbella capetownensis]
MAGCGDLLIGQLEFYWDVHFWPRLQGLTDEEYRWEPVDGMWSVRPDENGQTIYELADPVPDPPPLTTIAWRIVHIGVGCFAIRVNAFFEDGPDDADMFDPRHIPAEVPATAADGLEFLRHWYERWHDSIRGLDKDALWSPLGPKGANYADDPMLGLITHINREVMHHGAEICLLRDLYRAQVGSNHPARVGPA